MRDPTRRKNVTPGSTVRIDTSTNPKASSVEIGIIKKVLSKESYCKDGVYVLLENGKRGFVEEIVNYVPPKLDPDEENIKLGENDSVEFKSSFTFDYKRFKATGQKARNEKLEFNIPKSISGFANAFGGTLYIGVDNNSNILGLENDYEVMKVNSDQYEQKLRDRIDSYFLNDQSIYDNIEIHMLRIQEKDIFKIHVAPSRNPFIFFQEIRGQNETVKYPYFYVRRGNITKDYNAQSFVKYWVNHLKKL